MGFLRYTLIHIHTSIPVLSPHAYLLSSIMNAHCLANLLHV